MTGGVAQALMVTTDAATRRLLLLPTLTGLPNLDSCSASIAENDRPVGLFAALPVQAVGTSHLGLNFLDEAFALGELLDDFSRP